MSAAPLREDDQPGVETVDSPGRRLRIARQAKGLSQNDVATHLHLSLPIVQALEQDEHERLPGAVFVRGYLRNYAHLLGLDDDSLWNAVGGPGERAIAPAPIRAGVRPEIRSSHLGVRLVSWVIVLGLLGLLAAWWMGRLHWTGPDAGPGVGIDTRDTAVDGDGLRLPEPRSSFDTEPVQWSPPPVSATEPSAMSTGSSPPIPSAPPEAPQIESTEEGLQRDAVPPVSPPRSPRAEPESVVPADTQSQAAAPVESPAPVEPSAPAAPAAAAATDSGVVLEFSGPCWVDVRDSTRRFKLFGEMREGDRRVLKGTPPYSVILGNSPMVRITVDGEPFDVAAYSRGNVARFTIDPAKQE